MTLQNMRYIVAVAQYRSVSRAAAALYMTQSALSAAVKDAEEELGIQIFVRTNRGVTLTSDGEDCLRYCQEILERADRFSARYKNRDTAHLSFSVSTQRYPFTEDAFLRMLDTAKTIGLTMTDSSMLTPSKYVTAIIGLSRLQTSCHKKGCESCDKKDCIYRR